jgi:hypothetical protein
MQENFNNVFHIPIKEKPASDQRIVKFPPPSENESNLTSNEDNASDETTFIHSDNEMITKGSESESLVEIENNSVTANFQKNWNNFTQGAQQTFKKWQDDWDSYVKQSQEKMKLQNAKFKAQWEENNQKVKVYFQKQQQEFDEKTKKMQNDLEQQKITQPQATQTFAQTWNKMMKQQKKDMDSFQKIQTRLWWKGYFNFMLWILAIVVVLSVILYILKYFGFNFTQFITPHS